MQDQLTLCCLLSLHSGFGSWSSTAGTMCCHHFNQHVQGSPGENNSMLKGPFFGSHLFALCKNECRMKKWEEWVS